MTKTWPFPGLLLSKAILSPPGDHRGVPDEAPKNVSRAGAEPSAFATQISRLPERSDSKATRLPSGEYCGNKSYLVEGRKGIFGPLESRPIARRQRRAPAMRVE